MCKIEELLFEIGELRKNMCNLIETKLNLLDPKVVQASQELDKALNSYYALLENNRR